MAAVAVADTYAGSLAQITCVSLVACALVRRFARRLTLAVRTAVNAETRIFVAQVASVSIVAHTRSLACSNLSSQILRRAHTICTAIRTIALGAVWPVPTRLAQTLH